MEQPNLIYINQIAKGNEDFKKEFIIALKEELAKEIENYYHFLENKNLQKTKVYVHRVKHKMSILGLVKSYKITNDFENDIRVGDFKNQEFFEKTLPVLTDFLNKL